MTSSSPARQQRQGGGLEQLRRAVAQHDLLGLDAVALGERRAHRRRRGGPGSRSRARAPARSTAFTTSEFGKSGHSVLDRSSSAPARAPARARVRAARAARGSAPPRRRPRTGGSSRAGPSAGYWRAGRCSVPGPAMMRNQKPKISPRDDHADHEDALERARAPGRWPAARRTSFQAWSTPRASASVSISEASSRAKIGEIPAVTKPVQYCTCEPTHSQRDRLRARTGSGRARARPRAGTRASSASAPPRRRRRRPARRGSAPARCRAGARRTGRRCRWGRCWPCAKPAGASACQLSA